MKNQSEEGERYNFMIYSISKESDGVHTFALVQYTKNGGLLNTVRVFLPAHMLAPDVTDDDLWYFIASCIGAL